MKKMEGQTHSSGGLELAKSPTLKKLHPKMDRFPSLASAPANPLKPIFPGGKSLKSAFVLRSGLMPTDEILALPSRRAGKDVGHSAQNPTLNLSLALNHLHNRNLAHTLNPWNSSACLASSPRRPATPKLCEGESPLA